MTGAGVADVAWPDVAARPGHTWALLRDALVVRAAGFLTEDEARAWSTSVYGARQSWNADFGGEQFSLGRAWYTHLEEDRSREYFGGAAASNAAVERAIPGLSRRMLDAVASVVGERAIVRPGWCGPGVHVFPAGEHVAHNGGVVHFDTEGLSEEHAAARTPALTLVLMLQPPIQGGELTVWDSLYEGEDTVDDDELARTPSVTVRYAVGSLVVLDSYRLHQIQPFVGARDRISVTAHAARGDREWEAWF